MAVWYTVYAVLWTTKMCDWIIFRNARVEYENCVILIYQTGLQRWTSLSDSEDMSGAWGDIKGTQKLSLKESKSVWMKTV
jgi:hypothetical protein